MVQLNFESEIKKNTYSVFFLLGRPLLTLQCPSMRVHFFSVKCFHNDISLLTTYTDIVLSTHTCMYESAVNFKHSMH